MQANLQTFESRDALMQAAAGEMMRDLGQAVALRGQACAALSGGTTPGAAYERLAASNLDWPKITFALVDERFVPPSDPTSNEALVRRTLAPALAQGARVAPMYAADASLDEAAARASALYAPLHIDVALMGMGEDAHTASWFPDADRLREALDLCSLANVIAVRAPSAAGSRDRLTLTRAALARAGGVVLLICGDDKRARLDWALAQPPEKAPVAALFDGGPIPRVLWAS